MLTSHGSALTEEGVEVKVDAVMTAGNVDVESFHAMLIHLTPKTVAYMMNVSREDKDKGKGTERDATGIKVEVTAPYFAAVLISE